jgi:lipopolysaccharide transport system ATP-binding protein
MADAVHAIVVDRLAKRYRLGAMAGRPTLAEAITGLARKAFSPAEPAIETSPEFWALRDVSFKIALGETVGIVGANGAGKSTLLKILSRVTEPTSGSVRLRGRVGSLLEVGIGFHPELSGRDNIQFAGAVLGMSRAEIRKRFDEIVEFAEIGAFIDTPVKRYSSGMYMRLAFAVAAHLESEILLVDEVLAVGDMRFQQKCLARMEDVANEGRTVLFISHNLLAIESICPRSIWISHGVVAADGETGDVLARYRNESAPETSSDISWSDLASAPGDDRVRLRRATVAPADGSPREAITVKRSFNLTFDFEILDVRREVNVSVYVTNQDGTVVFSAGPAEKPRAYEPGRYRDTFRVPGSLMNDGTYSITVEAWSAGERILSLSNLLSVDILDSDEGRFGWYGKWEGVVRPDLAWTRDGPLQGS